MVQVPTASRAEVVHTAGVVDANDTVSPEVAAALRAGIEVPYVKFDSAPKEIV